MSERRPPSPRPAPPSGPSPVDASAVLPPLRDRFGLCQWFHLNDHRLLESTLEALDELGVTHLRTGISWADWHRPGGQAWYEHQMATLYAAGLELLVSVWHTPPSISLEPGLRSAAVPPRRTRDFADFIDVVIDRYGAFFHDLELWNEPNNPYKWDRRYDPDYERFTRLVTDAGHWARVRGKRVVLGGMTLLDLAFVDRMVQSGATEHVDVFALHAFPQMWSPWCADWDHPDHWFGWEHRLETIAERSGLPVWVTETGLATVQSNDGGDREDLQRERLLDAVRAPVERMYWYTLFDLDPARVAIEEANGGPREEAEYHMGLVRFDPAYRLDGFRKPAYHTLRELMRGAGGEAGGVERPAAD